MIYHAHPRKGFPAHGTFDDLEATVRDATKALRPHLAEFDSIVVTGMSGVVVGSPVALRLKKPLCIVRKPGEDPHGARRVVNKKRLGERALWLDDFIASGDTKQRVIDALDGPELVGQYLYQGEGELDIWGAT